MKVYQPNNTTEVGELLSVHRAEFQDLENDAGAANVAIGLSETAELAYIVKNRKIRFQVDGVDAFPMIVEDINTTRVSESEEIGEEVVVSGRHIVAEWERARVYPPNGLSTRPVTNRRGFGWFSLGFDDTSWPAATTRLPTVSMTESYHPPRHWPDPLSNWIGPGPFVIAETVGDDLYRREFQLQYNSTCSFNTSADDGFDLYIDGCYVQSGEEAPGESWRWTYGAGVDLAAGTHLIAVRASNYPRPFPLNIAGLTMTVFAIDPVNSTQYGVEQFVLHTGVQPGGAYDQGTFKVLTRPNPEPGWTAGAIIVKLLAEAQARGTLPGWTLGFNGSVDSAGRPWPMLGEVWFNVGDDYLTCLKQLAELDIDFRARAHGRVLDAYVKGTYSTATGVTFAEDANILSLQHSSQGG